MNYGTSSYGATPIGGSGGGGWYTFFASVQRDSDVTHTAQLEVNTSEQFFSVFSQQNSIPGSGSAGITYKVFTSNDPDEAPQLQSQAEGFYTQQVVGAARFITVTAFIDSAALGPSSTFEVRGRVKD